MSRRKRKQLRVRLGLALKQQRRLLARGCTVFIVDEAADYERAGLIVLPTPDADLDLPWRRQLMGQFMPASK